MISADRPTSLYRFRDAEGALLYVGISNRVTRRLDEHYTDKPWFTEIARVDVEHYATRTEARGRELLAIALEAPRYNVADAPTHPSPEPEVAFDSIVEHHRERILYPLQDGPMTAMQLEHAVGGVSSRSLRRTLMALVAEGAIEQVLHPHRARSIQFRLRASA